MKEEHDTVQTPAAASTHRYAEYEKIDIRVGTPCIPALPAVLLSQLSTRPASSLLRADEWLLQPRLLNLKNIK